MDETRLLKNASQNNLDILTCWNC